MTVVALVLLAVTTGAALPFHGTPPAKIPRVRAVAVLGAALGLLAAAAALGWRAAAVTGWLVPLTAAVAVAAAAAGGSPFATALLRLAGRADSPPGTPSPAQEGSLRGGEWIGLLERVAIGASVVAGWPAGIAVVLAVKGLGRYPELRAAADAASVSTSSPASTPAVLPAPGSSPAPSALPNPSGPPVTAATGASPAASSAAAERFIIGTFGSVLWAVGCAGTGWALLH